MFVTMLAMMGAATMAGAPSTANPVPLGNPGEWFGPAAYPPAAMRAGAQGRVVASVGVDAAGHATDCAITTSSGSSDLDAQTCRIATARMTFTPARDNAGGAVAGHYRLAVNWRLPNAGPPATPATTLVAIGPDGAILSCTAASPMPLGDLCAAFPTGRRIAGNDAWRGKVIAVMTLTRPLEDQ